AGMPAQPPDLVGERRAGDLVRLGCPLLPALPYVAAAPARHDEEAHAVREVEELVVLELAFETDGVEAEVARVPQLALQPFRREAQQDVGGPAAAADEDLPPVDPEEPRADPVGLRPPRPRPPPRWSRRAARPSRWAPRPPRARRSGGWRSRRRVPLFRTRRPLRR